MKMVRKIERPKIDIVRFLKRKGLTQRELAKKLNCSIGLVGCWASYRCVPSYEKCVELLRAGMTISELFGEQVVEEAKLNIKTSDFTAKVGEAIIDLHNSGFFKLIKVN